MEVTHDFRVGQCYENSLGQIIEIKDVFELHNTVFVEYWYPSDALDTIDPFHFQRNAEYTKKWKKLG